MSHLAHWSNYSMPPPHGLDFDGLLGCLLEGLGELGVVVTPEQTVFACMPSLGRRGEALPPAGLLLDRRAGAEHHAALVDAGCLIVEIRGAGWLPGRRYLVLLDHAWSSGSASPFAVVWAEGRGTVWLLSVASFERLERSSHRSSHSCAWNTRSRAWARWRRLSRCYEEPAESARAWLEVASMADLFARL